MIIDSKVCPNCGAQLKFKIGDEKTICSYCDSQINIDWEKRISDNSNYVHLNRNWEIFKKIFVYVHLVFILLIGLVIIFNSEPIWGILMIVGGLISIPYLSNIIFRNHRIIKIIIIEFLVVIGLFGGLFNVYPINISGKMYSKTSNMIVEVKGNYIIINDNGRVIKERFDCRKTLDLYGIEIYELRISNYIFKYKHEKSDKSKLNDKFYMVDKYGDELEVFYKKEQLKEFINYKSFRYDEMRFL